VLNECLARLGQPAAAPSYEAMARQVDKATGGSGALSLYDRYYRPTSTLAVHATAAALIRHVRSDGKVAARPGRAWTRRSPARIADTSVGILAHNIARDGKEASLFAGYARRHMNRALVPVAVVGAMAFATTVPTAQVFRMFAAAVGLGRCIWSGRAAADPLDVRTTRIRRAYSEALDLADIDVPQAHWTRSSTMSQGCSPPARSISPDAMTRRTAQAHELWQGRDTMRSRLRRAIGGITTASQESHRRQSRGRAQDAAPS